MVAQLRALILLTGLAFPHAGTAEPPALGDLQQLWTDLGTKDPAKAERALTRLAAQPSRAIPFLRRRLRPVTTAEPRRLAALLAELDSEDFEVRERATQELGKLGEVIETDLKKALRGRPSAEVRRRVKRLLEAVKAERFSPSAERLRAVRAVEVLERIGDDAARRLLTTIAAGAPKAQLTVEARSALQRLTQETPERP